ncbi:MAG: copper amine oxidase N-terminal domain-containing protein [Caldisericia bacterium]|nr:copper amine oxidase N-terminal domain-containing protein [Caldisericia bacterium]
MYYVDDIEKGPMGTPPVIEKSRIFLVVRYITQEIPGTTIDWIQAGKKVIITTSGGKRIELQIGNKDAVIDGKKVQIDPDNPDVVPFITAGRTHCPMRFMAEQLGATGEDDIKWFPETETVEIRFDIPDCERACGYCNSFCGVIPGPTRNPGFLRIV